MEKNKNKTRGFSLIEILVVISVFAVVSVLTTQSIFLTLRSAKKSESSVKVRENLDYAVAVMERHLRNAEAITNCSSGTSITYQDESGNTGTFACTTNPNPIVRIASGSAYLTSEEISVTSCSFVCTQTQPPSVSINLTGEDAVGSGVEKGAPVSISTNISLRNY